MSKEDYYEKKKDIISNKAKEYYINNKDLLLNRSSLIKGKKERLSKAIKKKI